MAKYLLPARTRVLIYAMALIQSKGWNQGSFAETAENHPVGPETDAACSFCIVGALIRAASDLKLTDQDLWSARRVLYPRIKSGSLWSWNDHPDRTKEDVLAALKAAALASVV